MVMENPFTGSVSEQRERPKALYHASPVADLEQIEPRNKTIRDPAEGSAIFATPDRALATVFLASSTDRWSSSGKINDIPYFLVAQDRNAFMHADKGGTIYELPADAFSCDPEKGLGKDEWVCDRTVRPKTKEVYPSALDAMIENGVQVYFVDEATLKRFQSGEYEKALIGIASENQRRGINVRSFEENGKA